MSSILDIDLDYFDLLTDAPAVLAELLKWAERPVDIVVENHAQALRQWSVLVRQGKLPTPRHILHVDQHHDMMNENRRIDISNVMIHAMTMWPHCRVYWIAQDRIEEPRMWLDFDTWAGVKRRFGMGSRRPGQWPRPTFVSVCTSPGFVDANLARVLLKMVKGNQNRSNKRSERIFTPRGAG